MQPRSSNILWSAVDIAVATAATLISLLVETSIAREGGVSHVLAERLYVKNFILFTVFLIIWTTVHQISGLYSDIQRRGRAFMLIRAFMASLAGSTAFVLFPLFSHEEHASFVTPMLTFFLTATCGSLLIRSAIWPLLPKMGRTSKPLRTLIVGSGPIALRLFEWIRSDPTRRHEILGFVDSPGGHTIPKPILPLMLGDAHHLEEILMTTAVDEVAVGLPMRSCYDQIQLTIQICERVGVPVTYSFQTFAHTVGVLQAQERALQPCMSWRPSRVELSSAYKRIFDVFCASLGLALLAPLFIVIGTGIKLSSPGPVFFIGERYGFNKQRFRMYKFRTMVQDAESRQNGLESRNEANGPVFKIKNDPRMTKFGRFLRKTSLDELPQLINVIRGEMSIVGPRPLPTRDVARFNHSWLMRRFSVKPGLTCLWQIRGRSSTAFEQWIAYDLEYIDTWSPMLDALIVLKTIPAVVRGTGAM